MDVCLQLDWLAEVVILVCLWIPAFICKRIFHNKKVENESVPHADSVDIKFFVWYPGNSNLEFLVEFWKYVGGIYMRGRFILKITQII